MRLNNELYIIERAQRGSSAAVYTIRLCPDSLIYKAHFPAQPITPGVCIVQIATEIASDYLGCTLALGSIRNAKFLAVLSPDSTDEADVDLSSVAVEGQNVSFKCILRNATTIFAKMTLLCKKSQ